MKSSIVLTYLLAVAALSAVSAGSPDPAVLTGVDRGVHKNFELLVFNCDKLPEFGLSYDRVSGEVVIEVVDGQLSDAAIRNVGAFRAGSTLKGAEVDPVTGAVVLRVKGLIFLRQYIVSSPPALLLDISPAEYTDRQLPYEMGADEYLLQGGIREREGRFADALEYLDHVRKERSSDKLLEHRAGIIQHQLGRFEAALETFSHTARIPELAADAHARRAMIYLAKGDTVVSGREWSEYFHRLHRRGQPRREETFSNAGSAETESSAATGIGKLTEINIEARSKMVIGWGLLGIGALTLILLLTGANLRRSQFPELYGDGRLTHEDRLEPMYSFDLPPVYSNQASRSGSPTLRRHPAPGGITRESSRQMRLPSPSAVQPVEGYLRSSAIIERSQKGADEMDIARELHVGRDEVAMVLNLARLAQEGQNLRRN